MPSIRQLTFLSLLAASTAQAHSLVNTHLFARQSDSCLNAINAACVDDETTCKNAICGASCTTSVPALSTCCSQNFEDLHDVTECLYDAVGDIDLGTDATAEATAASSTTSATATGVVATHASSSSTVAGGATTTSHPTGVVVTTSTHSGTVGTSTSATGTASTKGINVTTASGTPTPTGNAASGMGVAQAGVIGSALVWAAGFLVI